MSTNATRIESTIGHLVKALKTPTIGRVYADLATTARSEGLSSSGFHRGSSSLFSTQQLALANAG